MKIRGILSWIGITILLSLGLVLFQGYYSSLANPEATPPQPGESLQHPTTGLIQLPFESSINSPESVIPSSVSTNACYTAGQTKKVCYKVFNASPDGEAFTQIKLTFPTGGSGVWSAACVSQDSSDSGGNLVNFTCTAASNIVTYNDSDLDSVGEIQAGTTWNACVNLSVPSAYTSPQSVTWKLTGDGSGPTPHTLTDSLTMNKCTALMLQPDQVEFSGCSGAGQRNSFTLYNNTGLAGTFGITYTVPMSTAIFTGPKKVTLTAGKTITFTTFITPYIWIKPGELITASLRVSGNSQVDTSAITETILTPNGWQEQPPAPLAVVDNAVIWASQENGGIFSVGGIGANGYPQRLDPLDKIWAIYSKEISPTIQSPMDACYGLNNLSHEVVILFPEPSSTPEDLHIYNITTDSWYTQTLPTGYTGKRWAQDITSLLNTPARKNICYLSGGSTGVGGGILSDLWEYRPASNSIIDMGDFTYHPAGFNFHASWYVPWIGTEGAICAGGGIDSSGVVLDDTQCYDLGAASFNPTNADLGALPQPVWGMADGWRIQDSEYQIWIANGVNDASEITSASAYADSSIAFTAGPATLLPNYRSEGDGAGEAFFIGQGSIFGYPVSNRTQILYTCSTCYQALLPIIRK